MFNKSFLNILLTFILCLFINLYLSGNSVALAINFYLPWSSYQSHLVTQGNGGMFSHQGKTYYAWDFSMPEGTLILASASGKVIKVENSVTGYQARSWGNYIIIDHGNGVFTRYAHLQFGSINLTPGTLVKQGQIIARSGNTGNSTGPHLHYQAENKDGFSIPSSFVETGVPLQYQIVYSQNIGKQNSAAAIKPTKRVNYKRLYGILSSKEFKTIESSVEKSSVSPTEKYINSIKNQKSVTTNRSLLDKVKIFFGKNFISYDNEILNIVSLGLPSMGILGTSYYIYKIFNIS